MASKDKVSNSFLSAVCPDKQCRSKLYFPYFDTSIECMHCGQRHDRSMLQNIQEVSDLDARLNDMVRSILMNNIIPKRGTETVKVLGLSNCHCKLLSPLLTNYGMDKRTAKARLLAEMNQGDIFDCGLFGDRAFLIDQEHINVPGFGRDITGSMYYLSKTLDVIKAYNDNDERLIPIHADGDGHCLVHAVSRALVGRELFWHPLRCSLKKHFEDCLTSYKELFRDFVDECEWSHIIAECDPDFVPPEGEQLGLRNIHVFGLANVLKRPIILLDSLECMQSLGDYAALFLPSLVAPDLCRGKDNQLNKPLCIAWSSPGHNHYISLVGIKKKPLPILPASMLPKVWGVPQSQISSYIEFENDGSITIGGNRSLGDPYIMRLVSAMEELFFSKCGVHPSLVADVHHYLYQNTGVVGADRVMVIEKTKKAVDEGRLYCCLHCDSICEQVIKPQWFRPGGVLYNMALNQYERFVPNTIYPFPLHDKLTEIEQYARQNSIRVFGLTETRGIVCRYNSVTNELLPDLSLSCLETCTWCNGGMVRKVRSDGMIIYKNDDKTKTPSVSSTCNCGYKHFWGGKEYDNPPKKLNVTLEWNNSIIKDVVVWFENESNPNLNSNVYQVASEVVQKHFPGAFGSERLVQRVVQQILNQTRQPEPVSSIPLQTINDPLKNDKIKEAKPSKIIISGKGILHKEELGVSEAEKQILNRVHTNAVINQHKRQTDDTSDKSNKLAAKESNTFVTKPEKTNSIDSPPSVEQQKQEVVRVVTSDGRQSKLEINEEGITYDYLQAWITQQFQIPPECQKIKYGFPPQVLHRPPVYDDLKPLPLSHGDRVVVEKIVAPEVEDHFIPLKVDTSFSIENNGPKNVTSKERAQSDWENLLDTLSANDPLEMQSVLLSLSARISNQSVWNYVKKRPSFFKPGGLFYEQAGKEFDLINDYHFNLKTFPEKTFVYNAKTDSVELCVKPHGHFTVREGMETDIIKALNPNGTKLFCSLVAKNHATPDSVTLEPPSSSKVPRTEIVTPLQAEKSNTSLTNSKSIPQHTLIRKGPGYSVLNPIEPSLNIQTESLKNMVNEVLKNTHKQNMRSAPRLSLRRNSIDEEDFNDDMDDCDYDSDEDVQNFSPTVNHVNENKTFTNGPLSNSDLSSSLKQIAKATDEITKASGDPDGEMQCDISKPLANSRDIKKMDVDCV